MAHTFVERELKFDVRPGFVLPALEALVPAGGRVTTASQHLRNDYYDTDDHALLNAGITLRRRTGTAEKGWQLKVPHDAFRAEIHADADSDEVPEELSGLLVGVLRGRRPHHVARLITERAALIIIDADGHRLVEIDDDTVHASVSGVDAAILITWREIEVEAGQAIGADPHDRDVTAGVLTSTAKQLRSAFCQCSCRCVTRKASSL